MIMLIIVNRIQFLYYSSYFLFSFSVVTNFIYYLILFSLTFEKGKQPPEKERGMVCPQL